MRLPMYLIENDLITLKSMLRKKQTIKLDGQIVNTLTGHIL